MRSVSLLLHVCFAIVVLGACGPSVNNNHNGDDGTDSGVAQSCSPGATQSCYTGDPSTKGVGPCHGGTQTCDASGSWGTCDGEQAPTGEVCANGIDDNCNGTVDENQDADGDGFSTCGGDCCDATTDGCGDPKLVNPGAFEAPGNMVDDDCDGHVDNVAAATCDSGIASNSANGMDYAKAMDICQTATMTDKKWGVISATFTLPDNTGSPNASQRAVRTTFGSTPVKGGASYAVLSTGAAAATNQQNPNYVAPQSGADLSASSGMPADWLAANGGVLPKPSACPTPNGGTTAHDPIMLTLKIRAPTNAKSFSLSTNFFSAEFPEWVCSKYNDFFVVLLDSAWAGTPANPTDKNLAIYTSPANQKYPVGVNLAYGDTGLFKQCKNGPTGCASGSVAGNITTCANTNELAGTGFDVANPSGLPGYCGASNLSGGGTGWLVTSGNVKGGEVITLRIAIWDTSDGILDSTALIDNFQWSVDASQPGTVIF